MIKSRVTKSVISSNPLDYHSSSQALTYIPLAKIYRGSLQLIQDGLKIIQQQCNGKTYLIAFQGVRSLLQYSIYHNNSSRLQKRSQSGIWISSIPRNSPTKDENYLYLETNVVNNQDAAKIHTFCSLICSNIIVNVQNQKSLEFLGCLEGRVVYDKTIKDQKRNTDMRKAEICSLSILKRVDYLTNDQIQGDETQIYDLLSKSNVYDQTVETYSGLKFFKMPKDDSPNMSENLISRFENSIILACNKHDKSGNQLSQSPILVQYATNIVAMLNRKGMVDIQECKKSIQISDGYNGYLKALKVYHQNLNSTLREEGTPNVNSLLKDNRAATIDEYRKHSSDAAYLNKLNEYMDGKQSKVVDENNKSHDLKNINFLKSQSDALIQKISSSNQRITPQMAKGQIDQIVTRYNRQAEGDNKHELLANYLNVLNPIVYKAVSEKQMKSAKQQIEKYRGQNKDLSDKIRQMEQRGRGGCCTGKCQIM